MRNKNLVPYFEIKKHKNPTNVCRKKRGGEVYTTPFPSPTNYSNKIKS
jgi:hypothetical protein